MCEGYMQILCHCTHRTWASVTFSICWLQGNLPPILCGYQGTILYFVFWVLVPHKLILSQLLTSIVFMVLSSSVRWFLVGLFIKNSVNWQAKASVLRQGLLTVGSTVKWTGCFLEPSRAVRVWSVWLLPREHSANVPPAGLYSWDSGQRAGRPECPVEHFSFTAGRAHAAKCQVSLSPVPICLYCSGSARVQKRPSFFLKKLLTKSHVFGSIFILWFTFLSF